MKKLFLSFLLIQFIASHTCSASGFSEFLKSIPGIDEAEVIANPELFLHTQILSEAYPQDEEGRFFRLQNHMHFFSPGLTGEERLHERVGRNLSPREKKTMTCLEDAGFSQFPDQVYPIRSLASRKRSGKGASADCGMISGIKAAYLNGQVDLVTHPPHSDDFRPHPRVLGASKVRVVTSTVIGLTLGACTFWQVGWLPTLAVSPVCVGFTVPQLLNRKLNFLGVTTPQLERDMNQFFGEKRLSLRANRHAFNTFPEFADFLRGHEGQWITVLISFGQFFPAAHYVNIKYINEEEILIDILFRSLHVITLDDLEVLVGQNKNPSCFKKTLNTLLKIYDPSKFRLIGQINCLTVSEK